MNNNHKDTGLTATPLIVAVIAFAILIVGSVLVGQAVNRPGKAIDEWQVAK